jgi:hypothetical protein
VGSYTAAPVKVPPMVLTLFPTSKKS